MADFRKWRKEDAGGRKGGGEGGGRWENQETIVPT